MRCSRRLQKGFSLVSAIFIIVIVAVLGTYMSLMSINMNQSSAMSAQGIRAWYAATSGIEWVAFRLQPDGGTGLSACPAASSNLTIEGFSVVVTCQDVNSSNETESGVSYNIFNVSATATRNGKNFGDIDYVSRKIEAKIKAGPTS